MMHRTTSVKGYKLMNREFVFVHLAIETGYYWGANHGIAFIASILKKHSYNVKCLYISDEMSIEEFSRKIRKLNPSIVGYSCTTHQLKYLKKYSNALKQFPEILQIAGGAGVTLDPEWVLSNTVVNGACIGEGEVPIKNLAKNIAEGVTVFDTEGFYWNVEGRIKKNATMQFIKDLSSLDYPDYSIFKREKVIQDHTLIIPVTRGCPNKCSYCCNIALKGVYPSSAGYFRLPSVEYSIDLIKYQIELYPEVKKILFADDLLIANKKWFQEFADEYIKHINLPYYVQGRTEFINSNILELLKKSGCIQISLGVESGNEHLRTTVLNRKHSNRQIIEKCRLIKSAGITLFTFNIIGFPFEYQKERMDTYRLSKKIAPDYGVCTFFYPYKKTDLFDICEKNNLLKSEDELLEITNYNTRPSIKMSASEEKSCFFFQKKLSVFFQKQKILTDLAKFSGIRDRFDYLFIRWMVYNFWEIPALNKIVSYMYRMYRSRILRN